MRHAILTGALVGIWLQRPVVPRACSLLSVAHSNHARVHQPVKGPQLRVDAGAVSLTIPVDILPLMLANWTDNRPLLPAPSKWSQEGASQPRKIELVTLYKMNRIRIKIQLTCWRPAAAGLPRVLRPPPPPPHCRPCHHHLSHMLHLHLSCMLHLHLSRLLHVSHLVIVKHSKKLLLSLARGRCALQVKT
jgi:hypothetical protein